MTVQEQVLDAIRRMSVADLVDLVRAIATEPEVRQGDRPANTGEAGTDQGGVPTVSLRDWESNKLEVIKAVREVTDLGLREARQLMDSTAEHEAHRDSESDDGIEPAAVPAAPKPPPPSGLSFAEARPDETRPNED